MTEEAKLLEEAQRHYHREGGQLEAIRCYKILLDKYPNNVEGWCDLASMQYDIMDFDNAIRSSRRAISLEPDNAWNINAFLTKLRLLRKFKFDAPNMYLDEQTREAHLITELTGETSLFKEIQQLSLRLLELYGNNPKKSYELNFSFALTLIKNEEFSRGIDHLQKAIDLKEHRVSKRKNPLPQIYDWMSKAYLGLRDYGNALKHLDLAFENGLDDYRYLEKADILKEQGDMTGHNEVIEQFISIVDAKIAEKPELAFVVQKLEALIKLKDVRRAEMALPDFELVQPYDDRTKEVIEKYKEKIANMEGS